MFFKYFSFSEECPELMENSSGFTVIMQELGGAHQMKLDSSISYLLLKLG